MMRGDNIGKDLDAMKQDLESRFHWIWYMDLEQHVEEALAQLHVLLREDKNKHSSVVLSLRETDTQDCPNKATTKGARPSLIRTMYIKIRSWFLSVLELHSAERK